MDDCIYCGKPTMWSIRCETISIKFKHSICPLHVHVFKEHVDGMNDYEFVVAFGRHKPSEITWNYEEESK